MRLGDASHTATLEPMRFTRDYAVYEPPEGKTDRRGTKAWDEFLEANPGRTVLKQDEFDNAMRIRDAVRSSTEAMRYLRKGDAEVTLVWQDKETGIWCKCRLDFYSRAIADADIIAELKTARDVQPRTFQSAYARLSYHAQAAMQCDGLEAILGRPVYHKCISVESTEPHDTVVYDVIGEPLEAGQAEYRTWLAKLAECRRDDEWLGVAAGAEVSLRLPAWAAAENDDLSDLGLSMETE